MMRSNAGSRVDSDDRFDAVVVGGGHNGLTAAAYLAKAGLSTLVLERRDLVGGCCVTEEVDPEAAPGCRVSTASYIASMLRPEVIRDLELARHGLQMVACEPGVQAALPGGRVIAGWGDDEQLRAELTRYSRADADRFIEVNRHLKRLARFLQPFFLEAPPDIHASGWRGLKELLRVGRRFYGITGDEIGGLIAFLSGSLGDFLDRNFSSPEVKALLLANSLYGKHGGPYQPGTAVGLLFHLLSGGQQGAQGFQGHVLGGMGSITQAMAMACRDAGVTIRTAAAVTKIQCHDGRARGVVLEDGSEVAAKVVVSNADPKRTFLGLLDPSELDDEFLTAVSGIKMNGPCAKVNLVLSEEPQVSGMPGGHDPVQRSLFTLVPSPAAADRCYDIAKSGRVPDELWVDCVLASNVDPGLASAGRHMLTCFVQYVPYSLIEGSWEEKREPLGDRVVDIIGRYAPNVPGAVVARRVYTPLDLEQVFGITEGNIFHGDINLEQLFFMRPLPGWSQYVTPVERLYLCGAGTHPGGGVTGAPGYNAAHRIIGDFKKGVLK
jgi:phytoene dehydrogenase-like protein